MGKSVRKGGKHKFYADAWLPSDAIRGELVEHWERKESPLSVVLHLGKGVIFPEKPGVMSQVETRDKYTVVVTFNEYNTEWDHRFGLGVLLRHRAEGDDVGREA